MLQALEAAEEEASAAEAAAQLLGEDGKEAPEPEAAAEAALVPDSMTVAALQEELSKRGLDTKWNPLKKKKELVDRLQARLDSPLRSVLAPVTHMDGQCAVQDNKWNPLMKKKELVDRLQARLCPLFKAVQYSHGSSVAYKRVRFGNCRAEAALKPEPLRALPAYNLYSKRKHVHSTLCMS